MRLSSFLRFVPVLLACLGLSSCGESWSWNQKVTVTVETPDGEKSASSVIRYGLKDTDGWYVLPEARGARHSVSGEAVVLEVSPGRYLFALLKGTPNPFEVFFHGEAPVEVAPRFETLREARTVPRKQYPLLVTFADIADPASVGQVDPANLAATFGPGYTLKSVTLEITDEPVTAGKVESALRRKPGDGSLDEFWQRLPKDARAILSSVNWVRK